MSTPELPIVIVGPQGIGKSLLAREVARLMPGAVFVDDDCFNFKKLKKNQIVATNHREALADIKIKFTMMDINCSVFIDGKIFRPRRPGGGHQPMPTGRAPLPPPRKR